MPGWLDVWETTTRGQGREQGCWEAPSASPRLPVPRAILLTQEEEVAELGSLEAALARLRALLEDKGWHPLLVSTAGSEQPGDTWPAVCPGDAACAAAGGGCQLGPPWQAVSGLSDRPWPTTPSRAGGGGESADGYTGHVKT